jgi:uncharacterized protein
MGEGVTRDRDASGRPRNARPRDELGRPLARSDHQEAVVDAAALPPDRALEEAQRLLDAGRAFAAHEVLEAVWKSATGPERALWRGLAQLAVALTHSARGNDTGARALLQRAADTLASVEGEPFGVPVEDLRRWAQATAAGDETAGAMPALRRQAADERA